MELEERGQEHDHSEQSTRFEQDGPRFVVQGNLKSSGQYRGQKKIGAETEQLEEEMRDLHSGRATPIVLTMLEENVPRSMGEESNREEQTEGKQKDENNLYPSSASLTHRLVPPLSKPQIIQLGSCRSEAFIIPQAFWEGKQGKRSRLEAETRCSEYL